MVRVGFRTNANFETGSGHLHRCLTLASGLKETDPSCEIFFLTSKSEAYADRITGAGYSHVDLGPIYVPYYDAEATEAAIAKHAIDILVTDIYSVNEAYLQSIKGKVALLVVIDDYMHLKKYDAHMVVNPNLYAHLLQYECDADTVLLLGTEFAQLRGEFDQYQDFTRENPEQAKHILVTFGGSDLKGGSVLAVKALKMIKAHFSATIIAGRAFRQGEALAKEIGLDPRFNVIRDITDMSRRMASADLAISSPSTTFYELMLFRVPSVLITQAENQVMMADYAAKNGLSASLGAIEAVDAVSLSKALYGLMADRGQRDRMSARMDGLVDGLGRFRVAEEILNLFGAKKKSI